MKKTLVLGASPNPDRYAYKAIESLSKHGHEVIAIGKRKGEVNGISIIQEPQPIKDIHTIAMYLSPENQKEYYNYIFSLQPQRIIFNPGTENEELKEIDKSKGIEVVEWCVLVMLSSNNY